MKVISFIEEISKTEIYKEENKNKPEVTMVYILIYSFYLLPTKNVPYP